MRDTAGKCCVVHPGFREMRCQSGIAHLATTIRLVAALTGHVMLGTPVGEDAETTLSWHELYPSCVVGQTTLKKTYVVMIVVLRESESIT